MKRILSSLILAGLCGFLPRTVQADVQITTATGHSIFYDDAIGEAVIEGDAKIVTSSATLTADKITIRTVDQVGHLEGNVVIEQASGTLRGSDVRYNWQTSTGMLLNATGESPPWRFQADRMNQLGPDQYQLDAGYLTSCDANPPHYQFRSSQAKITMGRRATLKNSRLVLDETPAFYSPFYSRSLVPKKYTLRIEPGSSGRDGLITKTTFGYPFTPNTNTKLKWDYFQNTGNGLGLVHQYNLPKLRGDFDTYYVEDNNSDPSPSSRRWNLNWNHFEKFTDRLTGNARVNFKSDQTFGNNFLGSGSQGLVENQTRGLLSEAGLNYQFPMASLQAQVNRRDRFDSLVSSDSFIGKVTLPRLTFDTIPMKFKALPFYTSVSASFSNESQDRFTEAETLRYRKIGTLGVVLKRDLRIRKLWTLTPRVGVNETWQDRDFSNPDAASDVYQGRYTTGLDVRRRFYRIVDMTLGHSYGVRMARNTSAHDRTGDDRGIETNQLSGSLVGRVGRDTRLSLSSGYDLRNPPRSLPDKYAHLSERISPPSLDLQWQASKKVGVYFRETYSLFDATTRTSRRTPLNTSGEVQYGETGRSFYFSQGFNFSKTDFDTPSVLFLNNKLRMYASSKWFVDFYLSYQAVGPSKLNYKKVRPSEKTLRVVRDLHCWLLRMEFSKRGNANEASFYIDLKANMNPQKNIFRSEESPYLNTRLDETTIFPPAETAPGHN